MNELTQYILNIGIPTLAIITVGFILSKQIKSQKEMLDNYKSYIDSTDWKKVKEHYEQIVIPNELAKAEILITEEIQSQVDELNPYVDGMINRYKECLDFAVYVTMMHLTKKEGQKLIRERMPTSAPHFEAIWAWIDEHRPDHPETD